MLIYIAYNMDENNDECACYGAESDKTKAITMFKTEHLKQFLSVARSDIDYLKLAEVDVTAEDFALLTNTDEDCFFTDEDFDLFTREEVEENFKAKFIYEISGDQIGMQLHQYWMDNQTKYPQIPTDIAGEDDYYFDFIENLQVEDAGAYDQLVDDFIKSNKVKLTA